MPQPIPWMKSPLTTSVGPVGRIYQWIVNPGRRLPTGMTLLDLARGNLPQLENDADEALTAFVYQAEDRGVGFAFRRAAAHGGLACRHWWGHPSWPDLVDRFIQALDDPADPHWGDNGEFRVRLPAEPAAVQERDSLRRKLLQQPWTSNSAPPSGSWQRASATCVTCSRQRRYRP
jgi:hypothetical protein